MQVLIRYNKNSYGKKKKSLKTEIGKIVSTAT